MTTKPRLIALSGSENGTVFALAEDEVSIGREPANQIRVDDHSVSRRHCLIKRAGESFLVVDLESYNGTFVNGVPVGEQSLKHGDQIAVGTVVFLFLLDEMEVAAPENPVELSDEELTNFSTVRLERKDALYLKPAEVMAALPGDARIARDLNALLKISTWLSTVHELAELQSTLLETLIDTIPAERAALLFAGENADASVAAHARRDRSEAEPPIRISRSVVERVRREGAAILCVDVSEDASISGAESLVAAHVRSLLCAPLLIRERVAGFIYLDSSNPATKLDEGHLQLLTAVTSIAAVAIENVQQLERLQDENQRLHEEIKLEHNMIGESPRMREVYRFIERIAPADATVLIRGESGTGKELVAHAIHNNSARSDKQFVAINCAVLSETLLESELFGYEKGAFTGAVAQKRGRLEVANGGTLFLDEVGELTPATQSKLLRVLQERQFERVGGMRTIDVDVRIIAATNRNLVEAIKDGTFRQDLYYRLNVISLTLPALRERREDIHLLACHFVAKYSKKCKRLVSGISRETRECLLGYDWPGNVRELENAIERAVVLGNSDVIVPDDLPETLLTIAPASKDALSFHKAVLEMKKQLVLRTLEQTNNNYTEAAKLLGMSRTTLLGKMKRYGIR